MNKLLIEDNISESTHLNNYFSAELEDGDKEFLCLINNKNMSLLRKGSIEGYTKYDFGNELVAKTRGDGALQSLYLKEKNQFGSDSGTCNIKSIK